MRKIQTFFISFLLLLSCITSVTALADSQSTTVRYSVPAIVIYKDYDGTSTTQKVKVGTVLKAPKAKGKPGCVFEGWIDEKTGLLWDFATPVTEHMTLTASYSELDAKKAEQTDGNTGSSAQKKDTSGTTVNSPKTGDTSCLYGYESMVMLSVTAMVALLYARKKKKEE